VVGFHGNGPAQGRDLPVEVALDRLGVVAVDETAVGGLVEQFADGAEVFANLVDLVDQMGHELQIGVVVAGEVIDLDVAGLAITIDSPIALFQPRRIPRAVEMQHVAGRRLQVEPLGRNVGGDQHAHLRVGVVDLFQDLPALHVIHATV